MTGSQSSDCYMCGARNDAEASYCVRCDGQLLKLPAEDTDLEFGSFDEIDDTITETDSFDDPFPAERPAKARTHNMQDQRLSDALGLDDDPSSGTQIDPALVDTVVTSIPRATPSADIPLLGTRPGAVPQSSMSTGEIGRRTWVLLALLVLATGWLGYTTLLDKGADAPDSIAFTGTSVPPSSTTTTEKPLREWSMSEVDGLYSSVFVRVDLISCPTADGEASVTVESVGVNVDETNVVVDAAELPNASAAWIRSRTGRRRLATVSLNSDGLHIATTTTQTSRNLDSRITSEEPAFYVSYDPETNIVSTDTAEHDSHLQILVTSTGDAQSVQFGSTTVTADELLRMNRRVERNPDVSLPSPATACQQALALRDVVAEGTE